MGVLVFFGGVECEFWGAAFTGYIDCVVGEAGLSINTPGLKIPPSTVRVVKFTVCFLGGFFGLGFGLSFIPV